MPEGQVLALQKNDSTRDSRVIVSHGSFVSPALPLHENREVDKSAKCHIGQDCKRKTMSEPDELYTLRAQFWMGHYTMALDEAKQIQRRPMSPALKAEREEIVQLCLLALGHFDRVASGDTTGT